MEGLIPRVLLNGSTSVSPGHGKRKNWLFRASIIFGIMVVFNGGVSGQIQWPRRPQTQSSTSSSPAMEAYMNRWKEIMRLRSPSTTLPPRFYGNNNANNNLVVNGFNCDKQKSLFADQNNPRMYHLCAKNRDNWYIYHYFCPQGTVFDDSMRKCVQSRSTTVTTSRPSMMTPRWGSNRRPVVGGATQRLTTKKPMPSQPTRATGRPRTRATTRRTTTTTTTTTTEAPLPEPTAAPENYSVEDSTEAGMMTVKNVMISIPSFTMNSSNSSDDIITDDDDEQEESEESATEGDDEESNVIQESVVDTNTLSVHQHVPVPVKKNTVFSKKKGKANTALF